MKYMGSKSRIANDLAQIINEYLTPDTWYVEPFAGGMNMICNINNPKRIANDANKYLIAMWQYLTENGSENLPHRIERDFYSEVRASCRNNDGKYPDYLIGWVGFMGSFNGRFFDGGYSGHNVKGRDYIGENIRNTERQIDSMKGTLFSSGDYSIMEIPENSVIYCDIPYEGTKQYSTSINFDYERFWQWCRDMSEKGHTVLVSEYNAPEDFECIWAKELTNAMNQKNTYKPTERLFTIKK